MHYDDDCNKIPCVVDGLESTTLKQDGRYTDIHW